MGKIYDDLAKDMLKWWCGFGSPSVSLASAQLVDVVKSLILAVTQDILAAEANNEIALFTTLHKIEPNELS